MKAVWKASILVAVVLGVVGLLAGGVWWLNMLEDPPSRITLRNQSGKTLTDVVLQFQPADVYCTVGNLADGEVRTLGVPHLPYGESGVIVRYTTGGAKVEHETYAKVYEWGLNLEIVITTDGVTTNSK